jgi:hypothetical protein
VKSDTLDRQQAASAQGSNSAGPSEDPRAMTDDGGSQRRVEESEEGLQRRYGLSTMTSNTVQSDVDSFLNDIG